MTAVERTQHRLTLLLDLIAMATLFGTGELPGYVPAVLAALFVAAMLTRFGGRLRLSTGFWVVAIAAGIGSVVALWLGMKITLILAVSEVALILHGALWLLSTQGRSWALRLGLGFTELLIAAVLTVELWLVGALFVWATLASVVLSVRFLSPLLVRFGRPGSEPRLPAGYVRRSLFIAAGMLLSSVLIFPVLPRSRPLRATEGQAQVGYTERVLMQQLDSLTGDGRGRPVLRIRNPEGLGEFPGGLLRGRVLSIFDGRSWSAAPEGIAARKPDMKDGGMEFEAEREALGSAVLPVPYGTFSVIPEREFWFSHFQHLKSGEWMRVGAERMRTRYRFRWQPSAIAEAAMEQDRPRSLHLAVPDSLQTARMKRLAQSVFAGQKTAVSKAQTLMRWFGRNGFRAEVPLAGAEADVSAATRGWHELERFLFLNRKGHCERFAASAAVLLRLAGVPARLVAGFRVSVPAGENYLVVRSGNAHAWLEYWEAERGWRALDPTPRVFRADSFWNGMIGLWERSYDAVADRWYRFVVNYEMEAGWRAGRALFTADGLREFEQSAKKFPMGGAGVLFLLAAAGAVFVLVRKRTRKTRDHEGPRWLASHRRRTERRWNRAAAGTAAPDRSAWERWEAEYLRVRFGKIVRNRTEDLHRLEELARAIFRPESCDRNPRGEGRAQDGAPKTG